MGKDVKIIFLHHSTGNVIWNGGLKKWIEKYNKDNDTNYSIKEENFPKDGYPWNNYPYDYWNIWVKNAGDKLFKKQKTLEILTKSYNVIIWKHCYPVSEISDNTGNPDISSSKKTVENYKLQYNALKEKMKSFPNTRFIVWTGAVHLESRLDKKQANNTKTFFDWVRNVWDEPNDNIFIWDFYNIETEGGLYMKKEYARDANDSHPNSEFAKKAAPLLGQKIIDVIRGKVK